MWRLPIFIRPKNKIEILRLTKTMLSMYEISYITDFLVILFLTNYNLYNINPQKLVIQTGRNK